MTNLCACNLQQHQSFETAARISMWPSPGCQQHHCPNPDFLASHPNRGQSGLERLVRLGLVACEIALCSPIRSEVVDGRTLFTYQMRRYGEDLILRSEWRRGVEPLDFVEDVQDTMHGLQDADTLWVLCSVFFGPAMSRYTEVCALLEMDHRRLSDYCQIIHEHRETQKDRLWSKSSQARYDRLVRTVSTPRESPDHFVSYNSEKGDYNQAHVSAVRAEFVDEDTPKLRHRTGRIEPLPARASSSA